MSRDQQRLPDYLTHLLEAIERIGRYTENMSEAAFLDLIRKNRQQRGFFSPSHRRKPVSSGFRRHMLDSGFLRNDVADVRC
jgi:hypothetical protein